MWTQTLQELSLAVAVPTGTKGRDVNVVIGKSKLKISLKNGPTIVDAPLHKPIIIDDSFWTLEDGCQLQFSLSKVRWFSFCFDSCIEYNYSNLDKTRTHLRTHNT